MAKDFITQMNNAFDNKRYDAFSSYLNSKNTDMGMFASYRSAQFHYINCVSRRPKSVLGISTSLNNTACLYRNFLFDTKYKWVGLSDDGEFSSDIISKGYRTQYVASAMAYTENPSKAIDLLKQQVRWTRGGLQCFCKYFHKLIFGMFLPLDIKKKHKRIVTRPKEKLHKRFFIAFQKRYSCYDLFMTIQPTWILNALLGLIYQIFIIIYSLSTGMDVSTMLMHVAITYIIMYNLNFVQHAVAIIREYRNVRCNRWIFLYIFIWPLIDIVFQFVSFLALIIPTKWKHVPTTRFDSREMEEVEKIKKISELLSVEG